jgi:uncharacterized protein YgiM (DUF1202 family)
MKAFSKAVLVGIAIVLVFMGLARLQKPNPVPNEPTKIHTLIHTLEKENPHTRVKTATLTPKCRVVSGYEDGTVYLREGAGIQYPVLTVLHENDILEYLGKSDNNWVNVRLDNFVGYVNSKYVACAE